MEDRPDEPEHQPTIWLQSSDVSPPDLEHTPVVPVPVRPGWVLVPIRWVRDITVIGIGAFTILSQIYVHVVQHETPSVLLVTAGSIMLGVVLPGLWHGDRR